MPSSPLSGVISCVHNNSQGSGTVLKSLQKLFQHKECILHTCAWNFHLTGLHLIAGSLLTHKVLHSHGYKPFFKPGHRRGGTITIAHKVTVLLHPSNTSHTKGYPEKQHHDVNMLRDTAVSNQVSPSLAATPTSTNEHLPLQRGKASRTESMCSAAWIAAHTLLNVARCTELQSHCRTQNTRCDSHVTNPCGEGSSHTLRTMWGNAAWEQGIMLWRNAGCGRSIPTALLEQQLLGQSPPVSQHKAHT